MTYVGHVKNGVVVLDESAKLPEGVAVRVELADDLPPSAPGEGIMKHAGIIKGLPPDASRNLDHYLYGHSKQ